MKPARSFTFTLLLLVGPIASAELRVANVFGDHMVLQQEMPIRVWGWADPNATVVVGLSDQTNATARSVKAGEDGKWSAELPARKAEGKKLKMQVVSGEEEINFEDVLLGEVWICSGQSNMEWRVKQAANPQQEIDSADHPMIRFFDVPKHVKQKEPQEDAQAADWKVCSPKTISEFSAVGYYFGRELNKNLSIPIGLVGANWGGQRIEPFTPPVGFEQVPQLADYVDDLKQGKFEGGATQIYNGMVAGLTPLSVRGAIWYQGESNAGDGLRYNYLKEALVKGWRTVFENEDLSFYWVQLADFGRGHTGEPAGGGWGPVREGQRRALRVPNTGMAVIIDIGAEKDIHPKNKQDVGYRLALLALARNYGKDVVRSGPLYQSHKIEGNKIRISFEYTGSGLMVADKDGQHYMGPVKETPDAEIAEFSVQDEEGTWHWANAMIDGNSVLVWSDNVAEPKNVRYAYDSNPRVNLYNKEGLPASPFTTVD
ncbi:MAG: sialate O-acetylesterase [Planctomycetota bacterium]